MCNKLPERIIGRSRNAIVYIPYHDKALESYVRKALQGWVK